MRRSSQIVPEKNIFRGDAVIHDVTGRLSIFMFRRGWLQEQDARAIYLR